MEFELSQELRQIQQAVKNLVEQAILPEILQYEEKSILPMELFRKIGRKGLLKAHIPKEYGGSGLGTMALRPLTAIRALPMAVEVGLVVGTMPATIPTGVATSTTPLAGSFLSAFMTTNRLWA